MNKSAVLLLNLGSPDSPSVPDVRRYLAEFLMDGRVIDLPWPLRFAIVRLGIIPKRSKSSAHAYASIWTKAGSPLIETTRHVQRKLQERIDLPVEIAMRYQNPSIDSVITRLANEGTGELLLIPIFPHYAMSSYETAVERVRTVIQTRAPRMRLKVFPPYYNHPEYIAALVESAAPFLNAGFDHLLFSFHGLPERHLRKSDPTGAHCLRVEDCCSIPSPCHDTCYRAQCLKTVRAFAQSVGLSHAKFSIAFQSRLGRDPWMQPYTEHELARLGATGVKRLLVICPAFVSDCLETIEEIGQRGRETFLQAGGGSLDLVPCLNDHPRWIGALESFMAELNDPASLSPKTAAPRGGKTTPTPPQESQSPQRADPRTAR